MKQSDNTLSIRVSDTVCVREGRSPRFNWPRAVNTRPVFQRVVVKSPSGFMMGFLAIPPTFGLQLSLQLKTVVAY
jgi:hypothetical protein